MTVQEVFTIRGRGTVVTGIIEGGAIEVGDEVHIRSAGSAGKLVVSGIEISRASVLYASRGNTVGLLIRGLSAGEVQPGDVLSY